MSILNMNNLTHGFGDRTLLKDVSFRLLKGEHIGLVGANGVGKTTFINILTGRLLPDEGTVQWSPGITSGYLDQHSTLDPGRSIRDTLKLAFDRLYQAERQISDIAEKLANPCEPEIDKLLRKMGDLQDALDKNDFYRIDSHIEEVASGLGLKALGMDTPVDQLSGGQRSKVLLAKLLLENPDILLLDEPTNYLDKEHIAWITGYLKNYPNSFILVSHDTAFLNNVVNVIYHIEFSRMKRYPGNYEKFLSLKDQEKKQYIERYNRQQEEIGRLEVFIQKNIARASTSNLAKSRIKQLDRIERLEKPQIAAKPAFSFSAARESNRLIFECLELEIGYSQPLLEPLDLRLEKGDKIAVTGCNGIGKSTLLKTIMGVILPLGGILEFGDFLHPAYFEQEAEYKSALTALEVVWHSFPRLSHKEIRSALARCGLTQEHVNRRMKELSGGEQAKVHLCKLMLLPSNWLLLDEPTNHLDTTAKESLKEALTAYKGTVLLVCHEKEFYSGLVTGVWDMQQYTLEKHRYGKHKAKGSEKRKLAYS